MILIARQGGRRGTPVDVLNKKYRMAILGVFISQVVIMTGAKSHLSEMSPNGFLTECFRRVSACLVGNVSLLVLSVEKGFFDGSSQSLRGGHPWWFVLMTRVAIYGYFCFYKGRHSNLSVFVKGLPRSPKKTKSPLPSRSSSPSAPVVDSMPVHAMSSVKSESEPGSDFEHGVCAGSLVSMLMEHNPLCLSHCDCSEAKHVDIILLSVDFLASHLPQVYQYSGVQLCKMHAYVYNALRGHTMCSFEDCRDSGPTGPDAKYYPPKHFCASIAHK